MNVQVEELAKEWMRYRGEFRSNPAENQHAVLVCIALLRVAQDMLDTAQYVKLLEITEKGD